MKSLKKLFIITLICITANISIFAQIVEPVKWNLSTKRINDTIAELIFKATIDKGWHIYSQSVPPDGPMPTKFTFTKNNDYQLIGKVKEPKPIEENDQVFEMIVKYFDNSVVFKQKVKILSNKPIIIKGEYEFQACDEKQCIFPEPTEFEFKLDGAKTITTAPPIKDEVQDSLSKNTDSLSKITKSDSTINANSGNIGTIQSDEAKKYEKMSLWIFFFTALGLGFLAVLTPCIYPMMPMTVSYFMHNSKKSNSKLMAIVFGLSIIFIYVLVGTLVSLTLGESFANFVSTHWIPNLFFFILFLIFAASFFGMFEIVLPSWLVNKSDKQADKGGYFGAIFMAFTLVVVSFSCTAPIVGIIIAFSMQGYVFKPVIGMLGYSLAFAIPFTIFALIPSLLKNLPKSGGWLNVIKVVLGFIELALSLKFLSVADQTYHWRILDREVYLSLWIVIFGLMGLYLLGKLKFAHDSDTPHLGVPRLIFAIITLSFVVYMIPGLWGAPLKVLSGWIPPMTTHDFDIGGIIRENSGGNTITVDPKNELCAPPRYSEKLKLPHGIKGYFDYNQALDCSKKTNKPVFVDFTGHGCVNCRKMEEFVWVKPEVLKRLKENFVVVALYIDDKELMLPENEWYTSSYDGKMKKTLSEKNFDIQKSKFNANAQPYYVILDSDGNLISNESRGYNTDVNAFIKFLDDGYNEFQKRAKK